MKILKLLGVFLLFVGGIFLALNWNLLFTPNQGVANLRRMTMEEEAIQQQEQQREKEEAIQQQEQQREREEAIQLQEQQRERESAEAIAKAQARKEILELVNKRDLSGCRKHSGWNKYLTVKERRAVEAVLDMTKYKGSERRKVKDFLQGKKFSSYKEIIEAQKEIWMIMDK